MANLFARIAKLEQQKSASVFDFKCIFIQVYDASGDGKGFKPCYGWMSA